MTIRGGQRPKPTILKDLHGSTTPRNPDEPLPVGDLSVADCPRHFSREEKETWEEVLRASPPTMLKRIDARQVEIYVVAATLHRRASHAMQGRDLMHEQGAQFIPNPLISVINKQADLMNKLGGNLGFTPISRPRIAAPGSAISATMNSASHAKPKDAPRQSLEAYLASTPRAAVN